MKAEELNTGDIIRYENKNCRVLGKEMHGHGKVAPTMHIKLRDLESGHVLEHKFKNDEKVDRLDAQTVHMEYSFPEDNFFVFMDMETYEQVRFNKESLGEKALYLKENMKIDVLMLDGKPLSVEFPDTVTLKVVTAPEGVKGTDNEVELENGMKVLVPHFVTDSDSVVIRTEDGAYVERVTTKSLKQDDAVPGTGGGDKE